MSEETVFDIPPPPNQRVNQLFVWLTIDPEDGSEGIISYDMPMPFGTRHSPLMSSKREVAMKLRPLAETCAAACSTERGHPIEVVLRSFWA